MVSRARARACFGLVGSGDPAPPALHAGRPLERAEDAAEQLRRSADGAAGCQ